MLQTQAKPQKQKKQLLFAKDRVASTSERK